MPGKRVGRLTVTALLGAGVLLSIPVVVYPLREGATVSVFQVLLMGWTICPYLLLVLLFTRYDDLMAILVSGLSLLAFHAWMDWRVFWQPVSSTGAIALVFAPLWMMVFVLPLGYLAWVQVRKWFF